MADSEAIMQAVTHVEKVIVMARTECCERSRRPAKDTGQGGMGDMMRTIPGEP